MLIDPDAGKRIRQANGLSCIGTIVDRFKHLPEISNCREGRHWEFASYKLKKETEALEFEWEAVGYFPPIRDRLRLSSVVSTRTTSQRNVRSVSTTKKQ